MKYLTNIIGSLGFQSFGNHKQKQQDKQQNQDEGDENHVRWEEPSYHSFLQSLQRRGTLGWTIND